MKRIRLKNKLIYYINMFFIGIIIGLITRLTDLLPDNLWSFSSIATLFGFWIVSITIIVECSSSNKNSAVNVFLYMFGMTISFYGSQYMLGKIFPKFDNGSFKTSLCILYSGLSVICAIGGYFLYFWNKENKLKSFFIALPIGALLAEGIGTLIYFIKYKTYLFQFLFDFMSAGILGWMLYKKSNNKMLYWATLLGTVILVYWIMYRPFLNC